MNDKVCLYALRMVRYLQTCNSSVGKQIVQTTRNSTSRSAVLGLNISVKTNFPCAYGQPATSFRFLSNVASVSQGVKDLNSAKEESTAAAPNISDNGVHKPFEDKTDANYLDLTEEVERTEKGSSSSVNLPEEFQKCCSFSDVLDLCGIDPVSLQHISRVFTTMWTIYKNIGKEGKLDYEKQFMMKHPNFKKLCYQAMLAAPVMNKTDLVYTFYSVVKLQVPQKTKLVQTLLRVCQDRLSEFEEREISVLAKALKSMESCANVDSLRAGLRLLVGLRLPDVPSPSVLQSLMMCVGPDAPLLLQKKVVRKAVELRDQFTPPNAIHMIKFLAEIKFRSLPLLNISKRIIIDEIHSVPFRDILHVLKACKQLSFTDEELLTAVGDYFLNTIHMWQTNEIKLYLQSMTGFGFRHVPFLDAFADRVIENPQTLTLKNLLPISIVYAVLNHLPEGRSQQFLEALNSCLQLHLESILPSYLLDIVFAFCMLGFFPPLPLEKLMKDDVIQELLTSENLLDGTIAQKLHSVKLCLQLELKSTTFPGIAESIQPVAVSASRRTCVPEVETALEIVAEDPTHLKQAITLCSQFFIDYSLNIDTEQNMVVPLTYTPLPDNDKQTKRVAVLCLYESHFAVGSLHLLGLHAMKIRLLKAVDYHVVVVPVHKFKTLDIEERVLFLRNRIFSNGSPVTVEQE
uniref:RAP domain-containing protein n=1 Tax=Leptobrachium leishanense TaxID=445787 RepID=A0A8C5WJY7_9ANUR